MKLEKEFVTIGGGIGSFCFYNALRIHGVSTEDIAIITPNKNPYHQFKTHCENIGLIKLRSDSSSRPDNFWGFPGYGLSEALQLLKHRKLFSFAKVILQLFLEPVFVGYYCPNVDTVYKSIDRETERSQWGKSLHLGEAINLNRLENGKYEITFVDLKNKRYKIVANHIHIALGHGTSQYINYKNIFEKLKMKGGTVVLKGRGTSAACVLEQLLLIKSKKKITVISLHRNELPDHADNRAIKQKQFLDWRLQQFNWPKSAFGGVLMEKIFANGSFKYLYQWGMPSAVPNRKWMNLVRKSFSEDKYKIVFDASDVKADYTIDCTGFNDNPKLNNFYKNIIKKYSLPLNELGNIALGRNFEIEKLCGYKNRVSLSGVSSAGNYYGPVDSFFGHQYASLAIINNTPGITKLSPFKSFREWCKWILNRKI